MNSEKNNITGAWNKFLGLALIFASISISVSHATHNHGKSKKKKGKGKEATSKVTTAQVTSTSSAVNALVPSPKKEPCATDTAKADAFTATSEKSPVSLAPDSKTGCKLE